MRRFMRKDRRRSRRETRGARDCTLRAARCDRRDASHDRRSFIELRGAGARHRLRVRERSANDVERAAGERIAPERTVERTAVEHGGDERTAIGLAWIECFGFERFELGRGASDRASRERSTGRDES